MLCPPPALQRIYQPHAHAQARTSRSMANRNLAFCPFKTHIDTAPILAAAEAAHFVAEAEPHIARSGVVDPGTACIFLGTIVVPTRSLMGLCRPACSGGGTFHHEGQAAYHA